MNNNFDFQSQPLAAIWEINARIVPQPSDNAVPISNDDFELTDKEAEQLIRDVAELQPRVFVIAGDDPLRRGGIYSLIQYAASCGLHPVLALSPESNVTRTTITQLKHASLSRLELTLQGGSAETHDRNCGIPQSFEQVVNALRWANEFRLPVQIHTHLSRRNLTELESIASLLQSFRILSWSISFPVPQPGEPLHDLPSAVEFEEAFARIYRIAESVPFKVKTVDAPHYRRFVVQQRTRLKAASSGLMVLPLEGNGIPGVLPINEGMATLCISSSGDIYPSRWLRLPAGNVRRHKLTAVYRDSVMFESLRDTANLKGKCGGCEFKQMCGGSRARAWALTGDMFHEDASCSYQPMTGRRTG
jgi:AdoMet-dependent heme synthase